MQPSEPNDWAETLAKKIVAELWLKVQKREQAEERVAQILRTSAPARGDDELRKAAQFALDTLECEDEITCGIAARCDNCKVIDRLVDALSRPASEKQQTQQPVAVDQPDYKSLVDLALKVPPLKPCPFCGGEARMLNHTTGGWIDGDYVRCTKCYAETAASYGRDGYLLEYSRNAFTGTHGLLAARAWNARPKEGTSSCPECGVAIPHRHTKRDDGTKLITLLTSPPAPQSQPEQPPEASGSDDISNRFRKKPVVIEAKKLSEENGGQLAEWCGGTWHQTFKPGYSSSLRIPTLEGVMTAKCGDWIIRGVSGEFYPCKPDIFAKTYELVSVPSSPASADVVKDDPEFDGTDAAHPAWWRGHEQTTAIFCQKVNEILDGKDDGSGANHEPWGATRRRLLDLRTRHPSPAESKGPEGVVESKLANGETVQPEDFFK